jgi:hypothetical protein
MGVPHGVLIGTTGGRDQQTGRDDDRTGRVLRFGEAGNTRRGERDVRKWALRVEPDVAND